MIANSLAVSPDGTKVFVTGSSYLKRSNFDYATVAYDAATGARLWVKPYNGPGNNQDRALSLGVSPDGTRVFVTGWSGGVSSSSDYGTLAYDAFTGKRLWLARYNGPANSIDDARALAVSPDGSKVFVTGSSFGVTSNGDYATVAYDASTGANLWVKRYSSPGNQYDQANAAAVSPDSSMVFVSGQSGGSQSDYVTIAYDATSGAPRWVKRYNGPGSRGSLATSLGVSPDGTSVFVTGSSNTSQHFLDYATVAYDASTGATLWVARYHSPAQRDNYALSLAVSPDGTQLYVTGASAGSRGKCQYGACFDYATVAYDASSGNRLWVQRYNDPHNQFDSACCVGVSPDGSRVFVTGDSDGEYATLAYSTR
jgi:DNA-binding beta-propeller fold protein YncE